MHDLAGQPVPPPGVVGGLVAGQPGTARRVAVLDMDRPAAGGPVGDLPPAARARPGQRQVVAVLAAGQLVDRVLDDAEQRPRSLAGDEPERAVHHCGRVRVVPGIARGGDGLPPAARRPGRGGQPDQLRIGRLAPAAEIGRKLGQRLVHATQRSRVATGRQSL
jgi:hypothetical protein